jgi:putative cardiolipin synthase
MLLPVLTLFLAMAVVLAGCSFSLPKNAGEHSTALPPAEQGRLAQAVSTMATEHPELSGIAPLGNGEDAFAARMLLADAATTSIDTQYYIWRADLTGYLMLDRLKQAADRGVRVRLLLDDHGTGGLDPEIAALVAHPNVEVRLWNPFTLRRFKLLGYTFDFFRLNRRMHNKSFTVDGRACVLGGRNVGDEYFSTGQTPLFVDLDVLVVGKIVPAISEDFDRYWNSPSAYPAEQLVAAANKSDPIAAGLDRLKNTEQMTEYRGVLKRSNLVSNLAAGTLDLEWTTATLVSDDPRKGQGAIASKYLLGGRLGEAVGTIERRFDGVSAYFVPGAQGVKAFTGLEERGVEVRILTNSLEATDVLPVHAGYAKRRASLLKGGVELFELRRQASVNAPKNKLGPFGSSGASLHAKTFAVDGQRIFIGSFNFDPRSATLNTEMGVLIDSEWLAAGVHQAFDSGFSGTAWQVEKRKSGLVWIEPDAPDVPPLTDEPGANIWRKGALKFIGWLPVEWLL